MDSGVDAIKNQLMVKKSWQIHSNVLIGFLRTETV